MARNRSSWLPLLLPLLTVVFFLLWYMVRTREESDREGVAKSTRGTPGFVAPQRPSETVSGRSEAQTVHGVDSSGDISAGVPGKTDPAGGDDSIAGEYVLSFYNNYDREEFARLAAARGAVILGRMEVGNMLCIGVDDAALLDTLLREGPTAIARGGNHRVTLPAPLDDQPKAANPGDYAAFLGNTLNWLGATGDRTDWGRGITVALLDTGIDPYAGLNEGRITRVGFLDGAGEGGSLPNGHGTAVASLLLGRAPDVEGLVPSTRILGMQVLAADGTGDAFTVARAIVDAVNRGAQVINLSLGGRGDNLALRQAVEYALQQGAVVVSAAGNDAVAGVSYPARYDGVIAVAGVDSNGRHLYFSNRGPEVDVAAPGYGVAAASSQNPAGYFSGTSAAAPFVSGAVALLLAGQPSLEPRQILAILAACSNDAGMPGPDPEYGNGLLSIARLQERNTRGVYQATLLDPYIVPDEAEASDTMHIALGAQNRGTEALSAVSLKVTFNGRTLTRRFGRLPVGASVGHELSIPAAQIPDDGLELEYTVTGPEVGDSRGGNTRRILLLRQPQN